MILGLNLVVVYIMPLEAYMVVNFKVCEISRSTRKLVRTYIYVKLKKKSRGSGWHLHHS